MPGMGTVKLFQNCEEKLWNDFVDRSTQGTFFHLIGWKKVIEKTFPYHSWYLFAFDDCGVCGCLPLFHVKNRICGNALISVPFGVNGGICAHDLQFAEVLLKRGKKLAEELQVDYMELRHANPSGLDLPVKDLYVTFERGLDSDVDKNMAAIPRKQRRMIRQSMTHGLSFTAGTSEQDLVGFYNIYAQSVRNLGTPVFSFHYFKHLLWQFKENCQIFSVWHHEKRVSAVMTFFYKERVMPFYGGALKEYFSYGVNDFMYWELMKYACLEGYKIFDFGRSKYGTGSFNFKRHWGFEPSPLPYQFFLHRRQEIPDVNPLNPKIKPLIELWKRMPLFITKLIGPHIIKYVP